jgi:hypothetical protein
MEYESGQDHDRREQLSHGQRSQYESQLKVGFSEKLKKESKETVEDQKKSNHHAVPPDMERSDGKDVRIDVRIGNHAQHAVGRSQGKRFMFIPA